MNADTAYTVNLIQKGLTLLPNTYTPTGKLSRRTWARGITTDYSYDIWSSLTNTVYSDDTPTISLAHDALGRQIAAHDAAGVTTFIYDSFGSLTNETVIGVAGTNTIDRFYDNFGRDAGYSLNGVRQSALAYDPATGRLSTMLANGSDIPFAWNYLDGSDLKSSLVYPNGLIASWQYDANNQLLQVCNATPTNTISQYDYVYDAAGRRISVSKSGTAFANDDTVSHDYNARSELTNAVAAVDSDYRYSYDFDDIGNRGTSTQRDANVVYLANNLNQYTAVDDFTPQFDDDGNQTLVKTATGIWSVIYNGENRPIHWTCIKSDNQAVTNKQTLLMSFDSMGRRVTKNNQRFVYNGYLQIANFELQTSNIKLQTFIWDPTEKVATRPLVWNFSSVQPFNLSTSYYTHDGNKNVSEVVGAHSDVVAHYEYAPFGAVTAQRGASAAANPWRFSSEYAEDDTATVYCNYRHYNVVDGRWLCRDILQELGSLSLYLYVANGAINQADLLGLVSLSSIKVILDELAEYNEMINTIRETIKAAITCVNTVRRAFDRRDAKAYDKYNHCVSTCEISKGCAVEIAEALAFLKEARDLFAGAVEWGISWIIPKEWEENLHEIIQGGDLLASVEDYTANFLGIGCKNAPEGCDCCCEKYKGMRKEEEILEPLYRMIGEGL